MVPAPQDPWEKAFDVSAVCGDLLRGGIYGQRVPGMEMGNEVVGLQRLCHEHKRQGLPAGCGMLRIGGHAAELLSDACIHEGLS